MRARGLRFVTSFHHARNSLGQKDRKWTRHYEGVKRDWPEVLEDPERALLYGYLPREEFLAMWLGKLKEVIDLYQPDLMWFDSWLHEIPEEVQRAYLAYYFNRAREWNRDVVVTTKQDVSREVTVDDYEKGRANRLTEFTWLTDDTISKGSWCYTENLTIKPTEEVVHVLVDIVSKNGQLLLNISPRADGTIPDDQREVLLGLGEWLGVNGEAIYGTRPWILFGEGPTRMKKGGHFVGALSYSERDVRFTTKGDVLYAIFLGEPTEEALLTVLADGAGLAGGRVMRVTLLGREQPLDFRRSEKGLHIAFPAELPCAHAVAVRIEGLNLVDFEAEISPEIVGGRWQTEREVPIARFTEGRALLTADDATLRGSGIQLEAKDEGRSNVGFWDDAADVVAWKITFPATGRYEVHARLAGHGGGAFHVRAGGATLAAKAPRTGNWDIFETVLLGVLDMAETGESLVEVVPVKAGWAAMNLSRVELRRVK